MRAASARHSAGRPRAGSRGWVLLTGVVVLLCMSAATVATAAVPGHGALVGSRHLSVTGHARSSVKFPIVGLVDKGTQAPYTHREPWPTATPDEVAPDAGAFSGFVVNETWAQLEPSQRRFTFAPLQRSLAAVQVYNHAHPRSQLAVKLRLWGGFTAPEWAKTLGDTTPVTFATPTASGTTGRWWAPAYQAAWSTFQHRLATKFDDNPVIRTVSVSSCATLTDEPFVFSPETALHNELFADGWTSAAQQRCLQGAFSDYSGWKHTPIEYTFNPYVSYTPDTTAGTADPTFTDEMMTRCADLRQTAGRSCILSNHALDSTVATSSRSAPVYAEIDNLHAAHPGSTPADFQTFSPDTFGGCEAINVAILHHGQSVELWPPGPIVHGFPIFGGFSTFPESELAPWAHALKRHAPLSC